MKNCIEHTPEVWEEIFVVYPFSQVVTSIDKEKWDPYEKDITYYPVNVVRKMEYIWMNNIWFTMMCKEKTSQEWCTYSCSNWEYSKSIEEAIKYRDRKNKENLKEVLNIILWDDFFENLNSYIKTVNDTVFWEWSSYWMDECLDSYYKDDFKEDLEKLKFLEKTII